MITGASGHRLHEQLIFAGVRLTDGRPERLGVQDTEAALALALDPPVPASLRDQLVPRLQATADPLRAALQARAGDRARQLTTTLSARALEEQEHVAATLNELATTIRSKLSDEHGDQLLLFTGLELDAGERAQAERDLRSLNCPARCDPRPDHRRAGGDRAPLRRARPPSVPRRGHSPRTRGGEDLMARTAVRPRARGRIEDHHAEWLSLVETSGPFLTVPALKRALPDGLEATTIMPDLRVAYTEWRSDPGLQRRWVRWVIDELLGLREAVAEATDADPSHHVAEQAVTLRPSYVVRDQSQDGNPVVLLVHSYEQGTALSRPLPGERWAASPIDRAAELARATGVPLALVTDGASWTLVWAREGESTGICAWRGELWLEEPITLRAFVTLLGARRFFALPVQDGLAALLAESAGKQQEVADQLGAQVRRAVELLITTLDYEDRERHGELLADLDDAEVYRGAVTVMMRLVFLFVAEERRLLPIDDSLYAETLAASTLRAQLQEHADREGEDPLERSTAAWHRILALFRAVHGGDRA